MIGFISETLNVIVAAVFFYISKWVFMLMTSLQKVKQTALPSCNNHEKLEDLVAWKIMKTGCF
jgi:hypothetical protein